MNEPLAESYEACRQVARASASSFYFAFRLLPAEKRRAMYALYAFLRHTDDLADDPLASHASHVSDASHAVDGRAAYSSARGADVTDRHGAAGVTDSAGDSAAAASAGSSDEPAAALAVRRSALAEWRSQLTAALAVRGQNATLPDPTRPDSKLADSKLADSKLADSKLADSTLPAPTLPASTLPASTLPAPTLPDTTLPALADTVARYQIDPALLYTVIDGVESDLQPTRFATFEQLDRYCYQVATAVGLACLPIWGCDPSLDPWLVHQCGLAYQLTNILRDLKEDLARGRLYLPADELARFDLSIDDLRREIRDQRFECMMAWQVDRAARSFAEGRRLAQWLEPDGQRIFAAMTDTYEALLNQIRQRRFDVFSARVRLTRRAKWQIWLRALWLRPVPTSTTAKIRT